MKDEEMYSKILRIVNARIYYKPGTMLEEKIIKEISRKRKYSFLKTVAISIVILVTATFVFVDMFLLKESSSERLYSSNNIEQQVPKKFEPIYNISLVSDGF